MILGSNAGHTLVGLGTGAVGFLKESECTRQINNHFVQNAKKHFTVYNCSIDKSNDYLYDVVKMANTYKLDYAISHHLNCFHDADANGVEILVYDLKDADVVKVANNILNELVKLGFRNRGVKENKKLYWLSKTNAKALLIEYLFISNKSDVSKYNPEKLAIAAIDGLLKSNSKGPTNIQNGSYKYSNGDYNRKAIVVNTNGAGLNIRGKRTVESDIVGKLREGQELYVHYCSNNWFSTYVTGQLGFVNGAYVKLL